MANRDNIVANEYHVHEAAAPATPAHPQNLPYESLGNVFKGRAEFIADLRKKLTAGEKAVIRTRQAIHGMGGVGKTRAAVEYAWEFRDEYSALLFVVADSPAALEANLAALCGPRILNLPEQEAKETAVQAGAALRWLRDHPGWFLILDNVDTPEAQEAVGALLGSIPAGHIVITSRLADWPAGVAALDLDVLDPASSAAFLLERTEGRRLPCTDDPAVAAKIAGMLDGLALALEQCAAYVRQRRCALADYVAEWEGRRVAVLAWHDARKSQYPRSLAVTFDTSLAQLTPDARTLLHMLAWLSPEPLPVSAVEKMPAFADPRARLIELDHLHLVRLAPDGATCAVHRLLQEIARQHQPEAQPPALLAALAWMDDQYVGDPEDVRSWPVLVPLTPHAIAVATTAADRGIAGPTARLLNQTATLLQTQASYTAAEPLFRRALAMDEKSHGPEHSKVAIRLNNLGTLLQETNRRVEAEPLMRRALAIVEKSCDMEDPELAMPLNNLAQLLKATNRLAEAEPLMRRALAIVEKSHGPEHPEVAIHFTNLAQLLQATNRLVEAEPLMRRALAIVEKSYGPEHPEVAIRLNNLATLLYGSRYLAEAEPLMQRALAIFESSLGSEHPNVAAQLSNVAQLLQATNRLKEAEPLMRRALAIVEKSYGPEHPVVAVHLNNLAGLLFDANRFAEAEPLIRRAFVIDENSYGPEHPDVGIDLNNLAGLLKATNRRAEAEPLMRRHLIILAKFTAATGYEHPRLRDACGNYHGLLVESGLTGAEAKERVFSALREGGVEPGKLFAPSPPARGA